MGAEVVAVDCELDWSFPNYNPNPEDHAMLQAMTRALREAGADLALGFDGDGDRCGVVDDEGEEIFADKIGLILARDLVAAPSERDLRGRCEVDRPLRHRPSAEGGQKRTTVYWKTGHSYIKRKTAELGALAGFEKSGHFFFNHPLGRGYDDALVAAAAILSMLDRHPDQKLSDLKKSLPVAFTSLTMSPHCADELKYGVVDRVVADYQAQGRGRRIASLGGRSSM